MRKLLFLLFCGLFFLIGCKKEYFLQNTDAYGDRLSIAEAKKHFEKKFGIKRQINKLSSVEAPPDSEGPFEPEPEPIETFEDLVENKIALWNSAFEQQLADGQLVSAPLDVVQDGYVQVNGEDVVPFSSLNYVHMYKDANNEIQTYWVTYVPTDEWLYGQRATYSGLTIVRDWNGDILRVDNYVNGDVNNGGMSDLTSVCLIFDNGYRSPISGKREHCEGCIVTICATLPPPCVLCGDPPVDPPGPGGPTEGDGPNPGSGNGGGGGGSPRPKIPPPLSCNPDPNYVMPDYPAPDGMDWIMPCSGGPTEVPYPEPEPTPLTATEFLQKTLNDAGLEFPIPSFDDADAQKLLDIISSENYSNSIIHAIQSIIPEINDGNITVNSYYEAFFADFSIDYNYADWETNEDFLHLIRSEVLQQGGYPSSMIPEMYYINGTAIDMTNSPVKSRTVLGAPRNNIYFWKEFVKKSGYMLNDENLNRIKNNEAPRVNTHWVKYNPTHKAYMNDKLIHHHYNQGHIAYAMPDKVHKKWNSILHTLRGGGKINGLRTKVGSFATGIMILQGLFDVYTGKPDSWINWFAPVNKIGKLYYHPEKDLYFEITKKLETKDSSGKVIRAVVTYDVYVDYIWDQDENKYMGVLKTGTFTEYIDVINKTSTEYDFTS